MTIDEAFESMKRNKIVVFKNSIDGDYIGTISAIEKDDNGSYSILDDNDNPYSLSNILFSDGKKIDIVLKLSGIPLNHVDLIIKVMNDFLYEEGIDFNSLVRIDE